MALTDDCELFIDYDGGIFKDYSPNNLQWSNIGSIIKTDEKVIGSHSLYLDSVDDVVEILDSGSLKYFPMTFGLWMKAGTGAAWQTIFNKYVSTNGWILGAYNNQIFVYYNNGSNRINTGYGWMGLSQSQFDFFVFVITSDGLEVFKNNIYENHFNWVGTPSAPTNNDNIHFGNHIDAGNSQMGWQDGQFVYSRALSYGSPSLSEEATGEVAELWNGGLGLNPFNPPTIEDNLISVWNVNNDGDDAVGSHDMDSVSETGFTTDAKLGSHALIYDGIDDKSIISDHADFSFGDGTSDSPFTLACWVKMDSADTFRFFSKGTNTSNIEYFLSTFADGRVLYTLYDQTTANFISILSDVSITSKEGEYILLVVSYDGSSSNTGLKMYVNDATDMERVAATVGSGGSYTAMHSGLGDIWLGGSPFGGFSDGLIDSTYIWNRALSDGDVAEGDTVGTDSDIDQLWNSGDGLELPLPVEEGTGGGTARSNVINFGGV